METGPETTQALLKRIEGGERDALEVLFDRYRAKLHCMLRLRIHPRLRGRVDETDVIQEVLLEATQRLEAYLHNPSMPFFLWIRFLASQRLAAMHRHHLGVQARDARKEVHLDRGRIVGATSAALADGLAARITSPSQAAARTEIRGRLEEILERMEASDREILALRHFEQLTNSEAAQELGLDVSAASKRYVRALARLKQILARFGLGFE
jgi:RNA polymerase sigma-70 factor (ECF subfamily)